MTGKHRARSGKFLAYYLNRAATPSSAVPNVELLRLPIRRLSEAYRFRRTIGRRPLGIAMTEAALDSIAEAPVLFAGHLSVDRKRDGWGWAFIDLAALGNNKVWRYVVSILSIVLYPVVFAATAGLLTVWSIHGTHRPPPPIAMVLLMFGIVIAAGAAVVQSVAWTHRRLWLSVVSPSFRLDWRRLAIGAIVQASLVVPLLLLAHVVTGLPWRSSTPFAAMATAVLLIPLQAASEEILFRGYLTQAFGRIFNSRVVIIGAVAALFAAAHWNSYGPLTMPYMFIMSVIWSLVTLRDERLELSIGAHTAMNWLALEEIGSLVSGHATAHIAWPHLVGLVIYGAVFYGATRLAIRLFCDGPRRPTMPAVPA